MLVSSCEVHEMDYLFLVANKKCIQDVVMAGGCGYWIILSTIIVSFLFSHGISFWV